MKALVKMSYIQVVEINNNDKHEAIARAIEKTEKQMKNDKMSLLDFICLIAPDKLSDVQFID